MKEKESGENVTKETGEQIVDFPKLYYNNFV